MLLRVPAAPQYLVENILAHSLDEQQNPNPHKIDLRYVLSLKERTAIVLGEQRGDLFQVLLHRLVRSLSTFFLFKLGERHANVSLAGAVEEIQAALPQEPIGHPRDVNTPEGNHRLLDALHEPIQTRSLVLERRRWVSLVDRFEDFQAVHNVSAIGQEDGWDRVRCVTTVVGDAADIPCQG